MRQTSCPARYGRRPQPAVACDNQALVRGMVHGIMLAGAFWAAIGWVAVLLR